MSDDRIPLAVPQLNDAVAANLAECVRTNFVSSVGPFVERFEKEFAAFVNTSHAIACVNGTAALHVALKIAGVEPGDEVFVSDFTFIATVNPVSYIGAIPVLVDADEKTWNMNPQLVVDELERRAKGGHRMPKALMVAHLLGMPADLYPILEACARYGVTLIEDAAEALGASYSEGPLAGRQVGSIGRIGCFSFNGNKIITTGGGGMLVTDDPVLARRAKHLTTQARIPGPEYLHDEIGFNYRLTNVAAAIGLAQLDQLEEFIARKRQIAKRYDAGLSRVPSIDLPPRPAWANPTMWLYSIRVVAGSGSTARRKLMAVLAQKNIETRPVWAPAHLMPFYKDHPRLGGEVGERLFAEGLSLPCSTALSNSQQETVIQALLGALKCS